jgi:hypothetical protein
MKKGAARNDKGMWARNDAGVWGLNNEAGARSE